MKTFILVVAASLLAAPPAFADLRLTLKDGRVSIVAKDVTVRQILTEWMRVGQTKIVNVDRIPGGPVTLELNNVTEAQALDVLLRPLSGYIAAPRAIAAANLSDFDRIIIMPTLATDRPAVTASASPSPARMPAPTTASVYQEAPSGRQTVEEPSPYVEASYDESPAPDVPAPIMVAPVQANINPATMIQHSQETRRPGVLGNGIVPVMPKNPPLSVPPSEGLPFGAVAVPGMIVPGAQPVAQPPSAPVRRQ